MPLHLASIWATVVRLLEGSSDVILIAIHIVTETEIVGTTTATIVIAIGILTGVIVETGGIVEAPLQGAIAPIGDVEATVGALPGGRVAALLVPGITMRRRLLIPDGDASWSCLRSAFYLCFKSVIKQVSQTFCRHTKFFF